MITIINVLLIWMAMAINHEIGHLLSALLFRLDIQGFGYHLVPVPSFFVSIKLPNKEWKRRCFLLAGNLATIVLYIVLKMIDGINDTCLILAFILQFVTEYNPFYSDIAILFAKAYHSKSIKEDLKSYYRTSKFANALTCWILFSFIIIYLFI